MNLTQLAGGEKLFLARLQDQRRLCAANGAPRFSPFLDERQLLIAEAYIAQSRCERSLFYGGFPGAARRMLGIFPDWMEPQTAVFPVRGITARFSRYDSPSHRDFLGALLSLGIARDSVGDILVGEESAQIFLLDTVASLVLDALARVGRASVRCTRREDELPLPVQQYQAFRGTVSSARLDCLISMLTGLSRERSAALIASEMVRLGGIPARSASQQFSCGDRISVRGYGKFIVDDIGLPTRKKRLPVSGRKFL